MPTQPTRITWALLADDAPDQGEPYTPRRTTPKCGLCGRFARNVRLVFTGWPPEPDYELGDCCRKDS